MTGDNALAVLARIREIHEPIEVCSECGLIGCSHVYAAVAGHPVPPMMTVCRECHSYMDFLTRVMAAPKQWPCSTMAAILGAEELARR